MEGRKSTSTRITLMRSWDLYVIFVFKFTRGRKREGRGTNRRGYRLFLPSSKKPTPPTVIIFKKPYKIAHAYT
jgi:hypothetical protein